MFVTSLNQSEPDRPSFFEMMAQEQLIPALKPAIRYVASVVAVRNPRYEWFVNHLDEIFATGLFFLESRFLTNHDASFSENFYGLQRVRRVAIDTSTAKLLGDITATGYIVKPLRSVDRLMSLFFLVMVPYLKGKLDDYYKRRSKQRQRTVDNSSRVVDRVGILTRVIEKMNWLFVTAWPFLSAIYEGSFFVYQLLYMHDYTNYYTPFLHWQKLELKRLSLQDLQLQAREVQRQRRVELRELAAWSTRHKGFTTSVIILLKKLSTKGRHLLEDYGQLVLPLSIFLFKFLEWWYSNENLISPPKKDPIPPPPEAPTTHRSAASNSMEAYRLPKDKSECALCNRKRTNPACVASSGLVYCYPCIHKYVAEHSRCPITLLPTSLDQIFHLYDT
eukprot:TRINITY_DN15916_c0_g1_i1.p1 TRINITY_DN15916_c0_g1~~TRINITY_DN15916_c0_g1_i1.p1  ORF type:complete len:418 (+),score=60.77 TRINITY_DN15916_c0_g1_i1:87-1256(+)